MRVVVVGITKDEGSIVIAEGRRVGDNARVYFAGDHRPMQFIATAIDNDEFVEVDVEDWQFVLGPKGI